MPTAFETWKGGEGSALATVRDCDAYIGRTPAAENARGHIFALLVATNNWKNSFSDIIFSSVSCSFKNCHQLIAMYQCTAQRRQIGSSHQRPGILCESGCHRGRRVWAGGGRNLHHGGQGASVAKISESPAIHFFFFFICLFVKFFF
jgi:hypothetical protein